jgi:hypothetical protein
MGNSCPEGVEYSSGQGLVQPVLFIIIIIINNCNRGATQVSLDSLAKPVFALFAHTNVRECERGLSVYYIGAPKWFGRVLESSSNEVRGSSLTGVLVFDFPLPPSFLPCGFYEPPLPPPPSPPRTRGSTRGQGSLCFV